MDMCLGVARSIRRFDVGYKRKSDAPFGLMLRYWRAL